VRIKTNEIKGIEMEEEIEENQIWVEKGRMKRLIFGGISWCRRKRNLGFSILSSFNSK